MRKSRPVIFLPRYRIYYNEYEQKLAAGQLPKELSESELQVKLQQAQFLASLFRIDRG